jgi:predicted regulator of Ras-like GTPase activity (Roadblock/LC7/MglB family)
MDAILQSLMELSGVTAVLVFDTGGQLLGHRGRAIYDEALCAHVSGALAKALDAVQLQQEDWETVTAQYADGKIVLRRVLAAERASVLGVVADGTLNVSFATVALRVAAGKLKRLLEGAPASSGAGLASSAAGRSGPGTSQSSPGESRPNLANSGLSWSKISNVGLSRVSVSDPASGAFLVRCAKELAQYVGPIAKVYVEEAVRRVVPEGPFAMAQARPIVEDLAAQIEDAEDRAAFQKALAK